MLARLLLFGLLFAGCAPAPPAPSPSASPIASPSPSPSPLPSSPPPAGAVTAAEAIDLVRSLDPRLASLGAPRDGGEGISATSEGRSILVTIAVRQSPPCPSSGCPLGRWVIRVGPDRALEMLGAAEAQASAAPVFGASVSGRVFAACPLACASPEPITNAVIVLSDRRGVELHRVRVDRAGRFLIALPAGDYDLTASAPGRRSQSRPLSLVSGSAVVFDFSLD